MSRTSPPSSPEAGTSKTREQHSKLPGRKRRVRNASHLEAPTINSPVPPPEPEARKRRLGSLGQPAQKRVKIEVSHKESAPITDKKPSIAPSSAADAIAVDSDSDSLSDQESYDIPKSIGTLLSLMSSAGPVEVNKIKQRLVEIRKQAHLQERKMAQFKENAAEANALAKSREEQMDKMSTYMFPAQLINMWEDDRDGTIREDMRRQHKKADAKFEVDLEKGLVTMPEKPKQPRKEGPQKLAVWLENEQGEVTKDMRSWLKGSERVAVGRGR